MTINAFQILGNGPKPSAKYNTIWIQDKRRSKREKNIKQRAINKIPNSPNKED
jgi:hypothetical protein